MKENLSGVKALKKYNVSVMSVVFMLFALVSAGAYGIEEMIPATGPGLTIVMLAVFPFIWAMPISLMCAELGSALPAEGGAYAWAKEALGEFWAFQAGWYGSISTYLTNGAYVVLVVGYVGNVIEMTEVQSYVVKILMIAVFTIINLLGIREVGRASTIMSIIILIAFSVIAVVGFANWNYNPMTPFVPPGQTVFESLGAGIAICVWMYCGYESVSSMAGELKDPQTIPKGLMIAMPLIAASYILPTIGGLASIGNWQLWTTEAGAHGVGYASVATEFLGPAFGVIFLIVAIIGQCSIFNVYIAVASRDLFVLADDNLAPKFLTKVDKKKGVPYVGILSVSVVTMFLAQFDFTVIIISEVIFMLALYLIIAVSAIILRKRIPDSQRPFKVPLGDKAFTVMCCLPILIAVLAMLINGTDYFLMGLVGLATGPVMYIIWKLWYGGYAVKERDRYPINPKTKLGKGDLTKIGGFFAASGAFAFFGKFFLFWYEGEWGTDYYMEEYGEGFLSNFEGMLSILSIVGIITMVVGIVIMLIGRKVERE